MPNARCVFYRGNVDRRVMKCDPLWSFLGRGCAVNTRREDGLAIEQDMPSVDLAEFRLRCRPNYPDLIHETQDHSPYRRAVLLAMG